MNIIFYCQYVWGMGHLVRSLEFARALADHDVTLLAGGPEFLDDPGKALDEAYERGAPIMLVYTRDG